MSQLISLHTKLKLFVTSVTGDGHFYVQLDTPDAYSLPSLSEQLSQLVVNNPGKTRGFTPSPGTKCCAQSLADNNWYRALVIKMESSSLCSIYFVDYGNTETNVPITRLYPAISKYFEMPYQAVQCQLANFIPNGNKWSEEIVTSLSLNIFNQEVPGLFYGELPGDVSDLAQYEIPCYLTTLYWEESDDTYTVSDELVSLGMGTYPKETPEEIMSVPKAKPTTQDNNEDILSEVIPNDYSFLTLEVGQEYKLYVTHAESPDVVWGQLADRSQEIETLIGQLQEHVSLNGSTQILEDSSLVAPLSPGQPCLVLYSGDGNWCRGQIEEVDSETLDTRVLYVDFGNTDVIAVSGLCSLPSQFFNSPAQAVSFSLHGIRPVGDEWSLEAVSRFEQLYDGQELVAIVIDLDDNGYPSVRLLDPIEGAFIDEVLVQEEHAVAIEPPTPTPSTTSSVNDKVLPPLPPSSPSHSSTCSSSTTSATAKVTKPSVPSYTDTAVPIGQSIGIYITVIDSLDKFYCQLNDQSEELDKLTSLITKHCNSSEISPIQVALPNLPVLAKFSDDQNWYRGRLFPPKDGNSQWGVVFVDFGNSEMVNLNSLLSLPEPYLRLPVQSFECSLKGINPSLVEDSNVIDIFSELVLDQLIECVAVSISKRDNRVVYTVQLSRNGIDIATTLNSQPSSGTTTSSVKSSTVKSPGQVPSTVKASTPPISSNNATTIPSLSLSTSRSISVIVCYVESPLKFSCQLTDNSNAIKYLVSEMSSFYSGQAPSTPVQPVTGVCCAALFDQDNQWYRAVITEVCNENEVCVLFVDYGNSEIISPQNTRALTTEFLSLPNQAISCTLDKFPPNSLTNEMSIQFESMALDQTFTATFRSSNAGINSVPLSCELSDNITRKLIVYKLIPNLDEFPPLPSSNNRLTDKPPLSPSKRQSYRDTSSSSEVSDRQSRSKDRRGDEGRGSQSSDRSLSRSHREISSENRPRDERVYKRDTKQHDDRRSSSRDSSRSQTRSDKIERFIPLLSAPMMGWVSHIVSPVEFYIQPTVMASKLECLMTAMTHYYGDEEKGELYRTPVVNTFCCAFLDDEGYYRCRVQEILSSSELIVYSIDYGSTHNVQIKDVYLLNSKFYSLPAQVICCKLTDYTSNDNDKFTEKLINSLLEQEVEVTFTSGRHEDVYAVEVSLIVKRNLRELLNQSNDTSNDDIPIVSDTQTTTVQTTADSTSQETTPQLVSLPLGQETEGIISAISPDGDIYIQISTREDELDEILSAIASFMTNPLPEVTLAALSLKLGSYMLGQFTVDNNWYRALVLELVDDQVHVLYIDFGNQELLPLTRLHPISSSLLSYPRQAIKCQLEGLQSYQPSTGAIEVMENELSEVLCIVKASSNDVSTGRHVISMTLTTDSRNVSNWLLESGLFITTTSSDHKTAIVPTNNVSVQMDNITIDHPPVLPANNVPMQAAIDPTHSDLLKQYPIHKGNSISVTLSHQEEDKIVWVIPTVQSVELEAMTELLDESYSSLDSDLIISNPQIGQTCCAKCTTDGHWYRAVVTGLPWSSNIPVLYVDYGNRENVTTVYRLKPEFTSLPMSAIRCQTSSHLLESQWNEAITLHFLGKEVPPPPVWHVCITRPSLADIVPPSPFPRPPSPIKETTIPSLQIKPGDDRYEVYISHTESPNHFYCQLVQEADALEELMAQIADYYTDKLIDIELQVGSYCVAQYSKNNSWYRATIVQVISQDEVEVHFIDYGNREILTSSMIQGLNVNFTHLPIQAFPCSLLSSTNGRFSEDQLEAFFSLNFDEDSFQVRLKSQLSSGEWFVELYDQHGECPHELFLSPSVSPPIVPLSTTILVYPVPKYSPGSTVDVFVTCVNSPDDFYCQPLELASQLEELMTEISSFMSSCTPLPLTSVKVGEPCLAHYTNDSDWYRGQIDMLHEDTQQVTVRYVDYGNLALLSMEKISPLPSQFLSVPTQALHCSVLRPPTGETSPVIPSNLAEKFIRTLPEEEQYVLSILSNTDTKYYVEVSNGSGSLDFSFLHDENYSNSGGDQKESETDESPLHSSSLVPKNSKSPTTDLEESEEDSTATGEPLIHAPCKLSLLANEVLFVNVVHVKDPTLLYIQRVDCQSELESLSSEIAQYCTDCAEQLYQQSYQPGDFVLAQYLSDLLWYRALVMDLVTEGSFKVHFIDYGNIEIVSSKNMIMCPANFLELPVQAIPCSLSQVPSREGWPESYTELISELTHDKVLQASVVLAGKLNIPATVTLLDVENGLDIGGKVHECLDEECEAGSAPDSKIGKDMYERNEEKGEEEVKEEKEKEEKDVSIGSATAKSEETTSNGDTISDDLNAKIDYLREKLEMVRMTDQSGHDGSVVMEEDSLLEEVSTLGGGISLLGRVALTVGEDPPTANISIVDDSLLEEEKVVIKDGDLPEDNRHTFEEPTDRQELLGEESLVKGKEESELIGNSSIEKEWSTKTVEKETNKETVNEEGITTNEDIPTEEDSIEEQCTVEARCEELDNENKEELCEEKNEEEGQEEEDEEEPVASGGVVLNASTSSTTGSGSSTVLEPTDTSISDSITDSSLTTTDSPPSCIPTLQVGSHYRVLLVNTVSPYDFVCHLTSYSQVLKAMMSLIAQTYEKSHSTYVLTGPPTVGDIVCAKYTADDTYYRAEVLEVVKEGVEGNYLVEYIDYGNQEVLPLARLFTLNSELSVDSYPSFALHCSLYGLPEELPQEPDDLLENTLVSTMYDMIDEGESVNMEVIHRVNKIQYQVKLMNKDNTECVNDHIIDLITQHRHGSRLVNGGDTILSPGLTVSIKLDQLCANTLSQSEV